MGFQLTQSAAGRVGGHVDAKCPLINRRSRGILVFFEESWYDERFGDKPTSQVDAVENFLLGTKFTKVRKDRDSHPRMGSFPQSQDWFNGGDHDWA